MLAVRKQDPLFVNFVAQTAEEAVDRYIRFTRRGLKNYLIPECLISCSRGLSEEELEKFERWIISPQDDLSNVKLVETKKLNEANNKVFEETLQRVMEKMGIEDEKMSVDSQEDEKMCVSGYGSSNSSEDYMPIDTIDDIPPLPAIDNRPHEIFTLELPEDLAA